jgi:nitrogen fixation protein NifU and related proteins
VTRDEHNDLLPTGVDEPAALAAHIDQAVEALSRSSRREVGERLVSNRQRQIAVLVEHFNNPRHRGVLEGADMAMPGGSPECGGSVVIYLKAGEEEGSINALSFTGQGDIISQAATSLILEQVLSGGLAMEKVLALDYEAFVDHVGREAVGSRTRNATLGLSTLKSAIKKYQRVRLRIRSARAGRETVVVE